MWSQCPSRDWLNSERHIKSVRYCVVLQNDVAEVFLLLWKIANDSMKRKVKVKLFATPWTVAYQAPLSMEFSRQEYWSGWPFPSPGYLPNLGIEPGSPALQADTYHLSHQGSLQ